MRCDCSTLQHPAIDHRDRGERRHAAITMAHSTAFSHGVVPGATARRTPVLTRVMVVARDQDVFDRLATAVRSAPELELVAAG